MTNALLSHSRNEFSQNGEDGLIEELFRRLRIVRGTCCEFGAWDGVHFSNTRRLLLDGWSGMQIEGDAAKAAALTETYRENPRVTCICRFVDAGPNSLSALAREFGIPYCTDLDFLSVDIDGLDYEVLENLDIRPKVICIEVNAGHDPESTKRVPREIAASNVGQPLAVFVDIARAKGYALVCYTGNAFFVRRDLLAASGLSELSARDAYDEFLATLDGAAKTWLYRVNQGMAPPYYGYENPRLTRERLGLGSAEAAVALATGAAHRAYAALRRLGA